MPAGVHNPRQHLADLGLEIDKAELVFEFISQHGRVFASWGIDANLLAHVRNMHAAAWF